jgi:capsular exopolysaccharide synthesis family protein
LSSIYLSQPSYSHPDAHRLDLGQYVDLLRARWPVVAVTCLITLALGALHYVLTPKQYRATTTLQIEQRTSLPLESQNPWLAAWASAKYYPTQYRLLRSRGLAKRVVSDLGLDENPDFNPRRAALSPGEPSAAGDQAELARLAERLRSGISVDPVQGTELVNLSYVSSDPRLAATIANGIVQTFIDWGIETRSVRVGRTSQFIDSEIESLRQEIRTAEEKLQELNRSSDTVTLDPGTNLTLQRLEKLNTDLAAAQKDRIDAEAKYNELEPGRKESIAAESSDLVREMRRDLLRKENEYETKLQVYKPDWPDMVELKAGIEEQRRTMEREVDRAFDEARNLRRSEAQSARSRERRLLAEIANLKSDALDMSQAEVEYNYLSREIAARRGLLDELLKEQSETGMSARLSDERESNIRIVDEALVPTSPFRPSLRLDLLLGLAAGLGLGVGLVLATHFLDRTVKTPEELERLLGLAVLGVVPDVSMRGGVYGASYGIGGGRSSRTRSGDPTAPSRIELLPAVEPRLAVSEAYRSLRTALLLSSADELRTVTVTSAQSGEGKTATAANLAVVLAQLGKKTLLVDADLRKPRMHKIFDVPNRVGLVNNLTEGTGTEALFVPTRESNLVLCPAGPHPPNPAELLASERMRQFLEGTRRTFDFVVVDTPPVLAVTDAALVGSLVDGVVLCFRAHEVLRADIQSCRDRLQLADVKILGAVLNRYRPSRSGAYGRRYDYYRAYSEEVQREVSDSAA